MSRASRLHENASVYVGGMLHAAGSVRNAACVLGETTMRLLHATLAQVFFGIALAGGATACTAHTTDSTDESNLATSRRSPVETESAASFCFAPPALGEDTAIARLSPCKLDADGAPIVEVAGWPQKLIQWGIRMVEKVKGFFHFRFNFGRGRELEIVVPAKTPAEAVKFVEQKSPFFAEVEIYLRGESAANRSYEAIVQRFRNGDGHALYKGHQLRAFQRYGHSEYEVSKFELEGAIRLLEDLGEQNAVAFLRATGGRTEGSVHGFRYKTIVEKYTVRIIGAEGSNLRPALEKGLMPH
jgi:hypothetical protein